jgi:NADH:ubiquinone oxidoreductase subunit 6 (subunit J)
MRKWRSESALDVYNVLAAAVLFASPWLFGLTNETAELDFWLCGAAIVAISLLSMLAYANWEEWMNLVLGLWLIASPWVLGFAHLRAMHLSVGVGAVVTFMALLELWLMYDGYSSHQTSTLSSSRS